MISIRTERLVILAYPTSHEIPRMRFRRDVRNAVKRQDALEGASANNPDAEAERRLQAQQDLQCLCIHEKDGEQVGLVTSRWNVDTGICYLGYSIITKYRGLGYATEAVRAVMEWVLSGPDVKAVVAETYSDWSTSIRVMEKVGLTRVDTEIGDELVRYGQTKIGSSVDLTEKPFIGLLPFRYPRKHLLVHILNWQWNRWEEIVLLMVFGAIALSHSEELWVDVGTGGFLGLSFFLLRRILISWRKTPALTLIQFRETGMFYADRRGFGYVLPWKTFPCFRLPNRGGLELWNGATWYWIPPGAFTESSLPITQAFLVDHGVISSARASDESTLN
jgi:RimJ/RimL family protein N-acetyltransferase